MGCVISLFYDIIVVTVSITSLRPAAVSTDKLTRNALLLIGMLLLLCNGIVSYSFTGMANSNSGSYLL
ncbi:hypothetical protein V1512DRAFT_263954, partial [Lipomyces arxii]|uniref:uncharacterized protein n=1 Tax=Lipomyces arxii TaxID=56418 RepID=UPI0034CE8C39